MAVAFGLLALFTFNPLSPPSAPADTGKSSDYLYLWTASADST